VPKYDNTLGEKELFFPDVYYQNDLKLLPLFHDFDNLRTVNPEKTIIRQQASSLNVPCVFNFEEHPREIDLVLHRMSKFCPRAI